MKSLVYLSFDVKTDGPCPIQHSMIEIGIVAIDPEGKIISSFSCYIEERDNAIKDKCTIDWNKYSVEGTIYERMKKDKISPYEFMHKFIIFYKNLEEKYNDLIWIAEPSNFNWAFFISYYWNYGSINKPKITYKCRCISEKRTTLLNCGILDEKLCEEIEIEIDYKKNVQYKPKCILASEYQAKKFLIYLKLEQLFFNLLKE